MINSRLIIYLIYFAITIVVGAYLFIGWLYPEAIDSSTFHKNVYGIVFFIGWLVLIVLGLAGFFLFKNLPVKIYSAIALLMGVLWIIAIINQVWYKI